MRTMSTPAQIFKDQQKDCDRGEHAWRKINCESDEEENTHTVWFECYQPGCNGRKIEEFKYFIRQGRRPEVEQR